MPKNTAHTLPEYEPPEGATEELARYLLPVITAYFESEEGKREFAEWQEERRKKSENND